MASKRGPYASYVPPRCAPVADWLRQETQFGALYPSAFRLIELEKALSQWLPMQCRLAGLADGQLKILAHSSAQAVKLNQLAPTIVEGLARRGWQVTSVKVKVQGRSPNPHLDQTLGTGVKQAQMTAGGLDAWRALSATLAPSPLRDAIQHMITHHETT